MIAALVSIVIMLGFINGGVWHIAHQMPAPSRELRCYQGCVETYRADMPSEAAVVRLADCTDRCEGE